MSGVDVLAVLDRETEAIKNTKQIVDYSLSPERQRAYSEHLESLIESRAAVAELMDSVDSVLSLPWSNTAARELRAALSRCRGGDA